MNKQLLFVAACAAATAAVAASPFEAFKGRMKEGMYEYRMEMEMAPMPGMPPGMGKQSHNYRHCVTAKDIGGGKMGQGGDGKMPDNCEVKNFNMSGNSATYTLVCKGQPAMTASNKITFNDAGYNMNMDMTIEEGGQATRMKQRVEGRYLGPCK